MKKNVKTTIYIVIVVTAMILIRFVKNYGKWNNDGGYYKTNDVGYKELMDALKEMCRIQK